MNQKGTAHTAPLDCEALLVEMQTGLNVMRNPHLAFAVPGATSASSSALPSQPGLTVSTSSSSAVSSQPPAASVPPSTSHTLSSQPAASSSYASVAASPPPPRPALSSAMSLGRDGAKTTTTIHRNGEEKYHQTSLTPFPLLNLTVRFQAPFTVHVHVKCCLLYTSPSPRDS